MQNRFHDQHEVDNQVLANCQQKQRKVSDRYCKNYENEYSKSQFDQKWKLSHSQQRLEYFQGHTREDLTKRDKQDNGDLVTHGQSEGYQNGFESFDDDEQQNTGNTNNRQISLFNEEKMVRNLLNDDISSQQLPLPPNKVQQYEIEQQISNRYTKCLQMGHKYLKILKHSYYGILLRFLFIVLVYYVVDFNVYKTSNLNTIPNVNKKKIQQYGPWNVMIYFLSGSIDMISVIGYISAIRFLKSQIKVLEGKQKIEDYRMRAKQLAVERERRQMELERKLNENRDREYNNQMGMQSEYGRELQIEQIPHNLIHNQRPRSIRIGKQSTYLSIYSIIRQYKYKNKDQSAAFKITKIMHVTATFLFFGRKALIEQNQFEASVTRGNFFNYQLEKQLILWFFLITAYLGSFEIDLYLLEGSLGPYIKVQKFHISKINQVYNGFVQWRKKYAVFLKIGAVLAFICVFVEIVVSGGKIILFMKILLLISSFMVIKQNNETILKSQMYLYQKNQEYNLHWSSTANKIQYQRETRMRQMYDLQMMIPYRNLSLLGLLSHHSSRFQYVLTVMHRVTVFVFGLAILRESDINQMEIYTLCINVPVFLIFFIGQIWKFNSIMNFKLNLLSSCQYRELAEINRKQMPMVHKSSSSSNTNKQSSVKASNSNSQLSKKQQNSSLTTHSWRQTSTHTFCSVCLNQYEPTKNVIIICCGHVFHEECLLDWLKQKKQCPLCRLNIEDYYEEISF